MMVAPSKMVPSKTGEIDVTAADGAMRVIESMAGAAAWATNAAGNFTYITPGALAFMGNTVADLNASLDAHEFGWKRVMHPQDYDRVAALWRHCVQTGDRYDTEHRMRRADGVYIWVRTTGRPSRDSEGKITGWYGTTFDIDAQKRVEAALRDRERELSQLVDMVPSHLWRLTPDGEPIFFNKRMVDFLGLDVADTDKPGMSRLEAVIGAVIHPDDAAELRSTLDRCLLSGDVFSMRYRLRRADGIHRWMSSRAEPMRDESGRIVQWYGLCHDIDDQVHAEEALRHSERQLQEMIDAVPVRIWRASPTGGSLYFNKRYQDYLRAVIPDIGALGEPSIDAFIQALIHPEDACRVRHTLQASFEAGSGAVMRFRWREKEGAYRWAECRVEPWRDQAGEIVQWYGVSLDIDDEVTAQEALRRASDKLAQATQAASMAELSASIAHEMNQPLAAIAANSHACQRWLSAEPVNVERAKITVERIVRDVNAASDVVNRIRALFRHAPPAGSPEDVNRLIREVCRLMADETVAGDIRIETELEPDLPSVTLDRVQVQQVLVNLIRNGVEAMDGATGAGRVIRIRSRRDGPGSVRIEVHDAGTGFQDAERAFEPFFTTKPHGMGMGLTICRSIVESHGGKLWMANTETRGAVVAFTLPLAASEVAVP